MYNDEWVIFFTIVKYKRSGGAISALFELFKSYKHLRLLGYWSLFLVRATTNSKFDVTPRLGLRQLIQAQCSLSISILLLSK